MPVGVSRAEQNRAIRQEALRESLEAGGHIQHVVDISDKLSDLDTKLEATEVHRLKAAADIKLKLIDKYLPTLKVYEGAGDNDEKPPPLSYTFEVKDAKADIKITNAKPE